MESKDTLRKVNAFDKKYRKHLQEKEDYGLGKEIFFKELKKQCGTGRVEKYRPISTNGFMKKMEDLMNRNSVILLKDMEYYKMTPQNKPLFGEIRYALIINTKGVKKSILYIFRKELPDKDFWKMWAFEGVLKHEDIIPKIDEYIHLDFEQRKMDKKRYRKEKERWGLEDIDFSFRYFERKSFGDDLFANKRSKNPARKKT